MTLGIALKEMLHRVGMRQMDLAHAAGYKTVSVVSTPISRGDMCVSTLVKLANAAGYDVCLKRRVEDEPEYPIRIDLP